MPFRLPPINSLIQNIDNPVNDSTNRTSENNNNTDSRDNRKRSSNNDVVDSSANDKPSMAHPGPTLMMAVPFAHSHSQHQYQQQMQVPQVYRPASYISPDINTLHRRSFNMPNNVPVLAPAAITNDSHVSYNNSRDATETKEMLSSSAPASTGGIVNDGKNSMFTLAAVASNMTGPYDSSTRSDQKQYTSLHTNNSNSNNAHNTMFANNNAYSRRNNSVPLSTSPTNSSVFSLAPFRQPSNSEYYSLNSNTGNRNPFTSSFAGTSNTGMILNSMQNTGNSNYVNSSNNTSNNNSNSSLNTMVWNHQPTYSPIPVITSTTPIAPNYSQLNESIQHQQNHHSQHIHHHLPMPQLSHLQNSQIISQHQNLSVNTGMLQNHGSSLQISPQLLEQQQQQQQQQQQKEEDQEQNENVKDNEEVGNTLHSVGKNRSTSGGEDSFKLNSKVSQTIGLKWRNLDVQEKEYWLELARKEKTEHQLKYPEYKYVPRRRKGANSNNNNNASTSPTKNSTGMNSQSKKHSSDHHEKGCTHHVSN
ncbi:hypothetical protein ACO0QE_000208 [Hanseniaspora vineae]